MKRTTLTALVVALLVSVAAGAALAKNIAGTNGADTLRGTDKADTITGRGGPDEIYARGGADKVSGGQGADYVLGADGADILDGNEGADRVYGQSGNDTISGGFGDDRALRGGPGNDRIGGGLGEDRMNGDTGDDRIFAQGDQKDEIHCGGGFDVATVSLNDVVGGASVRAILSSVSTAEQDALSCEVLVLEGLRVPLGAIVALPADLESEVSLLLEEYLSDGDLSPEEISDLEELFALILQIEDEDDPGTLEQLLGDLGELLDGILG